MNLEEINALLEDELAWRQDEIRFLHNQLSYITKEEDQKRYRKALVVMLYSHFEGFCKTAFSIYANAINQEELTCSHVTDQIIASSLAIVFREFENTNKKSNLFRKDLPDDRTIHRFARQVELINNLNTVLTQRVNIPIDDVVDTEANLKPSVMKKILYRLGLPHDAFNENEGKLHSLLNYRNKIAHGSATDGLDEKSYEEIQTSTIGIMSSTIKMIMNALSEAKYLRKDAVI
ncbi:MAG TPA: MAE_28990/MAE_18760 family HEPN-like nuclease [Ktedonobacteraceae bacterium]